MLQTVLKISKKIIGWVGTILGAPFYFLYWLVEVSDRHGIMNIPSIVTVILWIIAYIYDYHALHWKFGFNFEFIYMTIGFSILGAVTTMIVALASGLIFGGIGLISVPGKLLFEFCRMLRMDPDEYREWEKKEAQKELERQKKQMGANYYAGGSVYDTQSNWNQDSSYYDQVHAQQEYQKQQEYQRQREQDIYQQAYKRAYQEGFQRGSKSQTVSKPDAYHEALTLFMLKEGFTTEELKKQYKRLLKAFHPDNEVGMEAEYSQKINEAYTLLKKYAK